MRKTSLVKILYFRKGSLALGLCIILPFVCFPLGVALFFLNGGWYYINKLYYFEYNGSRGWMIFWAIIFFPVCVVLVALNGALLIMDTLSPEGEDFNPPSLLK